MGRQTPTPRSRSSPGRSRSARARASEPRGDSRGPPPQVREVPGVASPYSAASCSPALPLPHARDRSRDPRSAKSLDLVDHRLPRCRRRRGSRRRRARWRGRLRSEAGKKFVIGQWPRVHLPHLLHGELHCGGIQRHWARRAVDRKSTRLNSSHSQISYAVFCLKKKKKKKKSKKLTKKIINKNKTHK